MKYQVSSSRSLTGSVMVDHPRSVSCQDALVEGQAWQRPQSVRDGTTPKVTDGLDLMALGELGRCWNSGWAPVLTGDVRSLSSEPATQVVVQRDAARLEDIMQSFADRVFATFPNAHSVVYRRRGSTVVVWSLFEDLDYDEVGEVFDFEADLIVSNRIFGFDCYVLPHSVTVSDEFKVLSNDL